MRRLSHYTPWDHTRLEPPRGPPCGIQAVGGTAVADRRPPSRPGRCSCRSHPQRGTLAL